MKLFGPVLLYDLVRMARRGRWFLLRTIYAGVMLLLLWLTFEELVGVSRSLVHPNQLAQFASQFFHRFMLLEFLAVLLLTPAYVGGAIAEEKVRQTMDYLLTTDLRNREIILGKLVSRLASLVLFLLAGVPVLALTQLFGGVSPEELWSGLAATFLTMLSLTSLTLWLSVHARRPRDAIILSYFVIICYYAGWGVLALVEHGLAGLFGATSEMNAAVQWIEEVYNAGNFFAAFVKLIEELAKSGAFGNTLTELLIKYAIFHGLVTLLYTTLAAWRVRSVYIRQTYGTPQKPGFSKKPGFFRRGTRRERHVSDKPMLWKEVNTESRFRLGKLGIALFALLTLMSVGTGVAILSYYAVYCLMNLNAPSFRELSQRMNIYVRVVGTALAPLLAFVVGVRAAASIGSERERQTLDGLLASPLEVSAIILSKWWGSLYAGRWLFYLLLAVWLLGVVTGGLHILALPLLIFLVVVYASFMASLGMSFAARSKTSGRAVMWTIAIAIFVGGGHWFCCALPVAILVRSGGMESAWLWFVEVGITPPAVLVICAFQGEDLSGVAVRETEGLVPGLTIGILAYLAAAVILRYVAVARFQQSCGRVDGQPRNEPFSPLRRIKVE